MVASFAVISSPAYYTQQAGASAAASYYASGKALGTWLRGHEALGIAAGDAVRPQDFDRICAGVDPFGWSLVKVAGARICGVDVTLSSPKAVSVLWALGDTSLRASIAAAESSAVEATLRLIDREISLARRGHGGAKREQARFVAAVFTHAEARPQEHADGAIFPDPQRHHHVCVPNLAQRPDGTWGSIDSVALRTWKKALGAVYRLQLATELQNQGFVVERADDEWKWTIAGVPTSVTEYFSARRASLEQELAEAGLTSKEAPALAAAVNVVERRAKVALGIDDLTQLWRNAAGRLGHEAEQIVGSAREAIDLWEHSTAMSASRDDRVARVPQILTEHNATFGRRDLIEVTANALVGTGVGADEALSAVDALIRTDLIIECTQTRDGSVYTTPDVLAAEEELCRLAARNALAHVQGPSPILSDQTLDEAGLNSEQQKVVRAATSGARLTLVQGGAGTGKSTSLRVIAEAWKNCGYRVVGAAVAWRAAGTLAADIGIDARAIDAWLAIADHGHEAFREQTCLIVEESGLQAVPQALRLLEAIDRVGGVAIMVGDEDQLRPIGPGHAMRLIRESVGATRIDTVVRQRQGWAREVPSAFARGNARQALEAFADRELIHTHHGPRATVQALTDKWQEVVDKTSDRDVLVLAKTNAEVRAVSAAIRGRMRKRGLIVGPDVALEACDASGHRHRLHLAAGDRIRFLARNETLGVINGTDARVTAIEPEAGDARITAKFADREICFTASEVADKHGRARLAHAYASTLFQAQGLSVEHSLVLLSSRFDRHDAYVASSRARGATEFFVDVTSLDREREQSGPDAAAETAEDAQLAYLATRLSRLSIKTNALDYATPEERAAIRRHERVHEL